MLTKRKELSVGITVLLASALLLITACNGTTAEKPPKKEAAIQFVGNVNVEPQRAPVDSLVTILGTGFPSDERFNLLWHTVEGSWDIRGDYQEEYHGRVFDDVAYTIGEVSTDAQGSFSAPFTVPDDYGFNHNITIEQGGQVLNRVGFDIEPTLFIEPASGPIGTRITITMTGIGWQKMENSWTLMYDNKYTGFLSAVTTKGIAKVVIPATGGPGKHIIKVLHGAYQYPYLNTEQNPRPDQPVFTREFTITKGAPVLPAPAEDQGFPVERGTPPANTGKPTLWTDLVTGPIETLNTLHGTSFPPGQQIQFLWYRVVGNRVGGAGWDETSVDLGMATVQADGSVSLPFNVPDDLGGNHRIEAFNAGNKVTKTAFVITPSVLPLEVSSGLVGTPLTIHIKGVGWTETANIYHLVYDNAYLGYACGFNSQGDVTIHLPLTGESGWHFIDLYPGIYKGKETKGVQNFRVPQLTYEEDHPGERLPAFHFAVQVTE